MSRKKEEAIRRQLINIANMMYSCDTYREGIEETGSYTRAEVVDLPSGNRGCVAVKIVDTGIPILQNVRGATYKVDKPELVIMLEETGAEYGRSTTE